MFNLTKFDLRCSIRPIVTESIELYKPLVANSVMSPTGTETFLSEFGATVNLLQILSRRFSLNTELAFPELYLAVLALCLLNLLWSSSGCLWGPQAPSIVAPGASLSEFP